MNSKWVNALVVLSFAGLSGCASMNAEECAATDWTAIGYEDGSRGYTADRFSNHRNACAKHGITPDFQAYMNGRSQGQHFGPGRGRRSAPLLQEVLGERIEHVGHVPVTTDDEAQALADTVFDQRARSFVCAEGSATGHPSIRVGTHLQLRGIGPRFENTYYVVSTHHCYDRTQGYLTHFRAESSALGVAP